MNQVMTQYAVPALGGAPTVIRCTRVSSRMTGVEDGAQNAGNFQGMVIQWLTPQGFGVNAVGPAQTISSQQAATQEPILLAGYPGDHPPNTVPIGNGGSGGQPVGPGGPATLGTAICQITSNSADATVVDVTEWF